MAIKDGDKVTVIQREMTPDDRKNFRYYDYMAGMSGTVLKIYCEDEVAVQVDRASMSHIVADVQAESKKRLQEKFLKDLSEEGKSKFTPEELNFNVNYVILAREADLKKA